MAFFELEQKVKIVSCASNKHAAEFVGFTGIVKGMRMDDEDVLRLMVFVTDKDGTWPVVVASTDVEVLQ